MLDIRAQNQYFELFSEDSYRRYTGMVISDICLYY